MIVHLTNVILIKTDYLEFHGFRIIFCKIHLKYQSVLLLLLFFLFRVGFALKIYTFDINKYNGCTIKRTVFFFLSALL